MLSVCKKSRLLSGPRSKPKKCKPANFSVDIKAHEQPQPATGQPNGKTKTENSTSLNKSKPSRKQSRQSKKHTKSSAKDSKDISHSVSAERKHSLNKMNRTEANFEHQDIERRVNALRKNLSEIEVPKYTNIRLIDEYYSEVKQVIEQTSQPLFSMCSYLHEVYMVPIRGLMQLFAPYEDLMYRREQIMLEIEAQTKENEKVFGKLDPLDLEIFKTKEIMEQQRAAIEEKRKVKIQMEKKIKELQTEMLEDGMRKKKRNKDKEKDKQKEKSQKQDEEMPQEQEEEEGCYEKDREREKETRKGSVGMGMSFKLDLESLSNNSLGLGFHDEFYSKIDQFSQSWRNQALKERRF